jgi:hypothetical protein
MNIFFQGAETSRKKKFMKFAECCGMIYIPSSFSFYPKMFPFGKINTGKKNGDQEKEK